VIDYENARRMNRLRWLWERVRFYRERNRSFTRLSRCAAMDMEIDWRYRSEIGASVRAAEKSGSSSQSSARSGTPPSEVKRS
jgi:hypothetical protein